jgi:predicted PolB exonuclease-like 3'-5' exonuclease
MLKREIPDRVWFFDMEWVPDAAAARRLYDLSPELTEAEAIKKLWDESGATEVKPRPFLKYLFSRIVSIAFVSRLVVYDGPDRRIDFHLVSYPSLPIDTAEVDESLIICEFLTKVGTRRPQLVGYNSAESDVQVLIQRGLVNEVAAPGFCERPQNKWDPHYFQNWDNEEHLDLMKLFSSKRGMAPRLDELAKLCGYPGKLDIDGQHVVDLWLEGDVKSIVEYNLIDTVNTYLVWLRIVHFCGKLADEDYADELMAFRSFLENEASKDNMKFVGRFLEKWEM